MIFNLILCNLIYYKLNIYDRKPASKHDSLEDNKNKYDFAKIYVFDLIKIQRETTVLINYYSSMKLSVYRQKELISTYHLRRQILFYVHVSSVLN